MATLQSYIDNKKDDEIIVNILITTVAPFEISYVTHPVNFVYVIHDEEHNIAVLRDLDYVS